MNVSEILRKVLNKETRSLSPLGGGSISAASKAVLDDSTAVFVKTHPQFPDMFVREADGLKELRSAGSIRIPEVIHADNDILILEFLPVSYPRNRKLFFESFGRALAQLHRHSSEQFGYTNDNYIGSTPQQNTPRSSSWMEFYWTHRLQFQFTLAEKNGLVRNDLQKLYAELEKEWSGIIPGDGEPPALLHGDLWSGNYLCIENDLPAIIDPAVYYGHREADLAMTLLFGGFDESFYAAYDEEYPLTKGWRFRMEVYKLYHLMNHLNLFGEGYYGQVIETIRRIVRR